MLVMGPHWAALMQMYIRWYRTIDTHHIPTPSWLYDPQRGTLYLHHDPAGNAPLTTIMATTTVSTASCAGRPATRAFQPCRRSHAVPFRRLASRAATEDKVSCRYRGSSSL